jgi:hypothetical protein
VLAFVVAGAWAAQVIACDKDKATKASAAVASKSAACTPEMAAACTPEMAAACKAKGAKSAKTAAYSASAASCGAKSTAVTAVATGKTKTKSAAYDHCASKTSATTAVASSDHCASKTSATTAVATSTSSSKVSAVAIGAGGSCGVGKSTTAGKAAHGDCDACSDLALCYEELEAAGARTQVVPLKNGVMFVYTAENPGKVNAVQSAMTRRSERLAQFVTAGDQAHLCADCRLIRGAMASGKMTREVVNIEGGALTLMTSTDRAVVAKIHALVESHNGSHSKI